MRTKGFIFLVWLVGMLHTQAGDHVTELWRTTLGTSGGTQYQANHAALDASDNLIVAGLVTTNIVNPGDRDVFLAKYNAGGSKLWEYRDRKRHSLGAELVKTDASGNLYVTLPDVPGDNFHLAYLKLSPSGTLIWRKVLSCMAGYSGFPHHALHVQSDGSSILLSWLVQEITPNQFTQTMAVTKFTPDGNVFWKTTLPGTRLVFGPGGLERNMHVDTAGNVFVTAVSIDGANRDEYTAFVLKLNPSGNQLWRTTFAHNSLTSILSGSAGVCVAGLGGWASLNNVGSVVHKNFNHGQHLQVLDVQTDGKFLVGHSLGERHFLVQPDGTSVWSADTLAYRTSNPVKDSAGGWLMAAHINHNTSVEYSLVSLRTDGNQRWRQPLVPFANQYYGPMDNDTFGGEHWLLRASNGSLRLICKQRPMLGDFYGIGIVSYRLETSTSGPAIVSTPSSVVNWDGANDLTLSFTVTGDGPLSYSVFSGVPQSESTITLPKENYPQARGFYRWDVTDVNGRRAATRNVLVQANQIRLFPEAGTGGSLRKTHIIADIFTRFRVEYSHDLIDWLPFEDRDQNTSLTIEVPADPAKNYFYRAFKIP